MNTKRPVLLLAIALVSSLFNSQNACAYNTVYVNNNDAVAAELIRQQAEHDRRYPSQDRSLEIMRNLYDSNKFFYKLSSVQEQLDYLLELYPDSIENGERWVAFSKTPEYDQKRYFWGGLFTAIGALTVQQSINYFKKNSHKTAANLSPLDEFLLPIILVGAPLVTIVSLVFAYNGFRRTTRWFTMRLQKDQEIYALLLKEAKKIKS